MQENREYIRPSVIIRNIFSSTCFLALLLSPSSFDFKNHMIIQKGKESHSQHSLPCLLHLLGIAFYNDVIFFHILFYFFFNYLEDLGYYKLYFKLEIAYRSSRYLIEI